MASSSSLVIFTDIEGTLCEPGTRACADARTALAVLAASDTPVVLVAGEGADVVIALQDELRLRHPFVCDGGAALYIPRGYFPGYTEGHALGPWEVVFFPAPYAPAQPIRLLTWLYRASRDERLVSVGLGDDWNDRLLLAAVDVPIIVRNPAVNQQRLVRRLPGAYRTSAAGPAGWREAILGPAP